MEGEQQSLGKIKIMHSKIKKTLYCPGQNRGWGPAVWQGMFSELINSRELTWRLFLRNFTARYRQTVLGFLWAIIMPLMTVATFVFLNRAGILNIGRVDIPYPAYALLGLSIWQIFAGGIRSCSNAIVAGGSMVVKINFPKECLVFSSFGEALVETLVRMVLTAAVFAFYRVVPAWSVFFFPFALIPLILFTVGLGFMLSLMNAVFRDIANVVSLASTFLLFVTPVLYPEPKVAFFKAFTKLNPLAVLVCGPRDLVVKGYLTQPDLYLFFSVFSLLLFIVSWRLFHLAEMRIAERVGAR
jgi:lipopolysaccharide transport system permease protein